jgi:hypothetical protein
MEPMKRRDWSDFHSHGKSQKKTENKKAEE